MALNPLPLAFKSPNFYRLMGFSLKPISNSFCHLPFPAIPTQIREIRNCSLCSTCSNPLKSSQGTDLSSRIRFGKMGSDHFRASAVSDGGSGGTGGYGGSGDGNYGGKGEGGGSGGENNWSLLSW